jgi:hypothetical protein
VRLTTNNLTDGSELEDSNASDDNLNVESDAGSEPALLPHVAVSIGEQLQTYYSHLMSEPVPDRFIQLLDRLDRKENGRDGN